MIRQALPARDSDRLSSPAGAALGLLIKPCRRGAPITTQALPAQGNARTSGSRHAQTILRISAPVAVVDLSIRCSTDRFHPEHPAGGLVAGEAGFHVVDQF